MRGPDRVAYQLRISEYRANKVAGMSDEILALAARRTREIEAAYEEGLRER